MEYGVCAVPFSLSGFAEGDLPHGPNPFLLCRIGKDWTTMQKGNQPAPMSAEDQDFLQGLFLANYGVLLRYAQTVKKNESGEDMVQETFLIASCRIDVLRGSPNPAGWLMRTLQNVLRKSFRKEAPLSLDEDKLIQDQPREPAFEGFTLLQETCMSYLSEEDWELLYKKSQGYTSKELAEEYSMRESACKMRISRAKALLRSKVS